MDLVELMLRFTGELAAEICAITYLNQLLAGRLTKNGMCSDFSLSATPASF